MNEVEFIRIITIHTEVILYFDPISAVFAYLFRTSIPS